MFELVLLYAELPLLSVAMETCEMLRLLQHGNIRHETWASVLPSLLVAQLLFLVKMIRRLIRKFVRSRMSSIPVDKAEVSS